ncbi:hypothetical protein QBC44DRAFT_317182 [Cladorrhinum sp. PSN332]|nr:hypothetical protein QBC44DRAFT_317182 [Cladorrhinum sp. PSN332]
MSFGRKLHYFLSPVPEMPVDGPIQLGSIVSSPGLVYEPVNSQPISPQSFGEKIQVHNNPNSQRSFQKSNARYLGLFAELPAFFNSTLGTEWASSSAESWEFDNLQTLSFTPSMEYLRKTLDDEDVQQFVQDNKSWLGGISLYMVTGLKIAYGASMLSQVARSRGYGGTVGLDLSALGVPTTLGPEAALENGSVSSSTFNSTDPVVFAFRLRKIKIKASGSLKHKGYTKGALLGLKDKDGNISVPFDTEGLEDDDATGLEFDVETDGDVVKEVEEEGDDVYSYSVITDY